MESPPPVHSWFSNLAVLGASAGLLGWSASLVHQRMVSVISVDAVINSTLIDLKAPTEGLLNGLKLQTGQFTVARQPLARIRNDRLLQLPLTERQTQIQAKEAELNQGRLRLAQLEGMRSLLAQDQANQSRLETLEVQQQSQQVSADIAGASAQVALAHKRLERSQYLQTQGALAQSLVDEAQLDLTQKQTTLDGLQARLKSLKTNQDAASLGLSLSRTRSNYDPRIRLQELELQIADQALRLQTLQQALRNAQSELQQARIDQFKKQSATIASPIDGLIWQLSARDGQFVQAGETIGQVLDCRRRWIDVWVDEKAVRSLSPQTTASIDLYGTQAPPLRGHISLIRSGIGRLAAGADVTTPVARNLPRLSQVRVDIAFDPAAARPDPAGRSQFCYVGYTGRVTFQAGQPIGSSGTD